ncbi:MAG: hypothetical protein IJ989_02345 [Paludibacteraceae bacterium]|nr:hypothetical protein [Paludibacteraceae bacterium]
MNNIFISYYLVATILMLILLWKYRENLFSILIILIAFAGTIAYWIPRGIQLMNIMTVLLSTYLIARNQIGGIFSHFRYLIIAFLVFSLYFVFDNLLVHGDKILFVFSQYSKYYVPFVCLLLFIHYARKDIIYLRYINHLIGVLLLIQVGMSIYKFILIGHHWEGMVGTFGGVRGGGTGTSFPLVALCWVALNSNMDIRNWKSWLFIAGLLLLGIAAGKRAVILLFPILFMALSAFVCKKKYSNRVWIVIAAAPLLFYLGVRLTPTFNPENKVWGTFDLEYMLNFTENYAMGEVEDGKEREKYTGRIGSALTFWNIFKDIDNYSAQTLLGEGVERAYTSAENRDAYNQFGQYYGLNHRGDITGVLMLYIAIGVLGVVLFVIYYWFLFRLVRYKRLRCVLFILVMFDFVFYNSFSIRDPFVNMLMMFTIVYSLIQYSSNGHYSKINHPLFM